MPSCQGEGPWWTGTVTLVPFPVFHLFFMTPAEELSKNLAGKEDTQVVASQIPHLKSEHGGCAWSCCHLVPGNAQPNEDSAFSVRAVGPHLLPPREGGIHKSARSGGIYYTYK